MRLNNEDRLIMEKLITIEANIPCKWNKCTINMQLFKSRDSKVYYVVENISGASIMNFNKEQYDEIVKLVPLEDEWEIYMLCRDNTLLIIDDSYRRIPRYQ